jgi:hypothetical protein
MGFHSNLCTVSGFSIPAYPYAGLPKAASLVVLVLPNDAIFSGVYNGYGQFSNEDAPHDGIDQYVDLVARCLELQDKPTDVNTIIKNTKFIRADHYTGQKFNELPEGTSCEYQGYFYPSEVKQEIRDSVDLRMSLLDELDSLFKRLVDEGQHQEAEEIIHAIQRIEDLGES